jgi:hypothetical protein
MSISVIIITFYPDDDDDRDGHRNVGILRTPNAADSPKRLYPSSIVSTLNLRSVVLKPRAYLRLPYWLESGRFVSNLNPAVTFSHLQVMSHAFILLFSMLLVTRRFNIMAWEFPKKRHNRECKILFYHSPRSLLHFSAWRSCRAAASAGVFLSPSFVLIPLPLVGPYVASAITSV